MTGPIFSEYDWRGGREAMLRFGPDTGPTVLAVPPLFEEANRTRAAMVDVLRRLATTGIGGALPDLPGTGESLCRIQDVTIADWRDALDAAVQTVPAPVHVMAWRGGAVIDPGTHVASCWHLAPLTGSMQMRELERLVSLGESEGYGGNLISDVMIAELNDAELSAVIPRRVVRLSGDRRAADLHLPGRPLWRAVEPDVDITLQIAIAEDVACWVNRCGG